MFRVYDLRFRGKGLGMYTLGGSGGGVIGGEADRDRERERERERGRTRAMPLASAYQRRRELQVEERSLRLVQLQDTGASSKP